MIDGSVLWKEEREEVREGGKKERRKERREEVGSHSL